jgi:hypothetical protein
MEWNGLDNTVGQDIRTKARPCNQMTYGGNRAISLSAVKKGL